MTASQEIINFLKDQYPRFIHKGRIFGELADLGYMPDTLSRCCRKLAETGKIERLEGKQARYRWKADNSILAETKEAFKEAKEGQGSLKL
jgi:hypothetical protein|tara:strand:+ start:303 stop:572 length:270 start_codon:yes stop_codon:yes gene_type:complete